MHDVRMLSCESMAQFDLMSKHPIGEVVQTREFNIRILMPQSPYEIGLSFIPSP
jgi:hypothetical protein